MTTATEASNEIQAMYKDFRIGVYDGRAIMLRVPRFECGYYWAFGYLGNMNVHFHLDNLEAVDDSCTHLNLYEQLENFFGDTLTIPEAKRWTFCEVVLTIYMLKQAAALFYRGGAYYVKNPDELLIENPEYVDHINNVLIPKQIHTLYAILAE